MIYVKGYTSKCIQRLYTSPLPHPLNVIPGPLQTIEIQLLIIIKWLIISLLCLDKHVINNILFNCASFFTHFMALFSIRANDNVFFHDITCRLHDVMGWYEQEIQLLYFLATSSLPYNITATDRQLAKKE